MEIQFNYLKDLFTKFLLAGHRTSGTPNKTPVFILGMPRSGTSLVERILVSHPEVHGASEQYDLIRTVEANFGGIGDAAFADGINSADAEKFSAAEMDISS